MPVAFAILLASFCAGGSWLYISSAGSAAMRQQLDETCRTDSALVLPIPRAIPEGTILPTGPPGAVLPEVPFDEIPGARETVERIGATVPFTDAPLHGAQTLSLIHI